MKLLELLEVLKVYDYYLYDYDNSIIYDYFNGSEYKEHLNDNLNKKRNLHLNDRVIKEVLFINDNVHIYLEK